MSCSWSKGPLLEDSSSRPRVINDKIKYQCPLKITQPINFFYCDQLCFGVEMCVLITHIQEKRKKRVQGGMCWPPFCGSTSKEENMHTKQIKKGTKFGRLGCHLIWLADLVMFVYWLWLHVSWSYFGKLFDNPLTHDTHEGWSHPLASISHYK